MYLAKRTFRLVVVLAMFAVLLAACGMEQAATGGDSPTPANQAATGETQTATATPREAEPEGEADRDTDEADEAEGTEPGPGGDDAGNKLAKALFQDARQASQALDSFSVKMNVNQTFTFGGTTESIQSTVDVDAILKPSLAIRTKTAAGFGGEQFETTMILTESALYMHEPFSDMWMEWPADMAGGMGDIASVTSVGEVNPLDQLEEIAAYLDAFDVEETSEGYRLSMESSDSKFRGLLASQLAKQGEMGVLADLEETFEQVTIRKISYDFLLGKDDHLIRELRMFMDFSVNVEGQKTDMVMEMDATYYNHNNVADIPLPENTMTLQDMGFGF